MDTAQPDTGVINFLPDIKIHDQSIRKIAHNTSYVFGSSFITNVADALNKKDSFEAVAVVDEEMHTRGILVNRDITGLLSRPYGRDVLRKKTAEEMCVDVRRFNIHDNIFSVAELLDEAMKMSGILYYLITDDNNRFHGIFSTKGMLIYLSQLTTQDIATARRLQTRIVKEKEFIDTPNLEIVSSSVPAKGVGGDFYTIHKYNDSRWLLAVCDVSGKGVSASVLTSVLWGMMSIYDYSRGLKVLVQDLNNYIVQTFEGEKFVTAIFVDFDENTGETIICDMGHSHIFIFRDSGLHNLKTNSTNLPVGIMPDVHIILNSFQMKEKDIMFLLTDGLVEQVGMNETEYSIKRIEAILREKQEATLEEAHDAIQKDFSAFRGKKQLHDDVTYLFLKYLVPRPLTRD
jgi:phosphoserine phosphatase RsbU/P